MDLFHYKYPEVTVDSIGGVMGGISDGTVLIAK